MKLGAAVEARFWRMVSRGGPDDCWPWTGCKSTNGYGKFGLNGVSVYAHRVSAQLAGMSIEGLLVCHQCDNPPCVNPHHLFPGTHKDNGEDMSSKGRSLRGERGTAAKITAADVMEIRRRNAEGELQRGIAADFGIHEGYVSTIVAGATWGHLPMVERKVPLRVVDDSQVVIPGVHPLVQDIRRARITSGHTMKSMSEAAGVHENTIRRMEFGMFFPSFSNLLAITEALGLTLSVTNRTDAA